jgi:hypothetical protein
MVPTGGFLENEREQGGTGPLRDIGPFHQNLKASGETLHGVGGAILRERRSRGDEEQQRDKKGNVSVHHARGSESKGR